VQMELWSCCWRWSSGAATEDEVEGVLQDYNGLTFCFSLLFVRPPVFFRPCSLVFPPGFCGASSVRSSPVLCGLSLAFIKPANAMQLPLDNEATDRCCRRRIVGSWQEVVHEWRRWWTVFFETAPFKPKMDISNLPPEFLTFSNWILMEIFVFFLILPLD
jgi:hypothetical protein